MTDKEHIRYFWLKVLSYIKQDHCHLFSADPESISIIGCEERNGERLVEVRFDAKIEYKDGESKNTGKPIVR